MTTPRPAPTPLAPALESARTARRSYDTAVEMDGVTYVPWGTVAADLALAASDLQDAGAPASQVIQLTDRARHAAGRARRMVDPARTRQTIAVVREVAP